MKLTALVFVLLLPSFGFAHGGGLDQYGCHHDNSNGSYHCHRGGNGSSESSSGGDVLKVVGVITGIFLFVWLVKEVSGIEYRLEKNDDGVIFRPIVGDDSVGIAVDVRY